MTRAIGVAILTCLFSVVLQAEDSKEKVFDAKLASLTALTYASALYDTHTTVAGLARCHDNCYETNYIMRPFVHHQASAYAFSMAATSAAVYGAYRLRERHTRWWWVPMAATAIIHIGCGIQNQHIR